MPFRWNANQSFRLCLCACFALAPWNSYGHSSWKKEPSSQEILSTLLREFQRRQEQHDPIWVKFKIDHFEAPAWKPANQAADQNPNSSRVSYDGEYARKGTKTRSWAGHPNGLNPLRIFNGEVTIQQSAKSNRFILSNKADSLTMTEPPWSILGEEQIRQELQLWADGKAPITSISVSEVPSVDGNGLLTIEWVSSSSGWKHKCWVMPAQDWSLHRYEVYNDQGGPISAAEATRFMTIGGAVFAASGGRKNFLRSGELGRTDDFEVQSLVTSAREVPDRLFQVDFPPDAEIWDEDLKVFVRNSEIAQSHLDEIIRRATAPRSMFLSWLLIAATAGALIAVGCVAFRRRPHKSSDVL
jgi:hypothetical protein